MCVLDVALLIEKCGAPLNILAQGRRDWGPPWLSGSLGKRNDSQEINLQLHFTPLSVVNVLDGFIELEVIKLAFSGWELN